MTSCSISLSGDGSATGGRTFVFPSSSCFNRCISGGVMPTYFPLPVDQGRPAEAGEVRKPGPRCSIAGASGEASIAVASRLFINRPPSQRGTAPRPVTLLRRRGRAARLRSSVGCSSGRDWRQDLPSHKSPAPGYSFHPTFLGCLRPHKTPRQSTPCRRSDRSPSRKRHSSVICAQADHG